MLNSAKKVICSLRIWWQYNVNDSERFSWRDKLSVSCQADYGLKNVNKRGEVEQLTEI